MNWTPIKHGELRDGAKLRLGVFTLMVHRVVTVENLWFMTIRGGPIDTHQLEAQTLEDAKTESIEIFKRIMSDALHAISLGGD